MNLINKIKENILQINNLINLKKLNNNIKRKNYHLSYLILLLYIKKLTHLIIFSKLILLKNQYYYNLKILKINKKKKYNKKPN